MDDNLLWIKESLARIEDKLEKHFNEDSFRFREIEKKLTYAEGNVNSLRILGGIILGLASLYVAWRT